MTHDKDMVALSNSPVDKQVRAPGCSEDVPADNRRVLARKLRESTGRID